MNEKKPKTTKTKATEAKKAISIKKETDDLKEKISVPLKKLSQAVDEVMEDLFLSPEAMAFEPDLDLFESGGMLIMEVVLPGVEPEDIFLKVDPNKLLIQGELLESEDYDEGETFIAERFYGPFQRIVDLPVTIDPNATEAFYRDGILRVEMMIEGSSDEDYEEDYEDYDENHDENNDADYEKHNDDDDEPGKGRNININ
jgi:HSP20 family protein